MGKNTMHRLCMAGHNRVKVSASGVILIPMPISISIDYTYQLAETPFFASEKEVCRRRDWVVHCYARHFHNSCSHHIDRYGENTSTCPRPRQSLRLPLITAHAIAAWLLPLVMLLALAVIPNRSLQSIGSQVRAVHFDWWEPI